MCGLVGLASSEALNDDFKKMFSTLLIIDTIRGPHSTGVFSVDKTSNEVQVVKRDVEGYTFVNSHLFTKATSSLTLNILAGHNRHATKGKINTDNAHPFTHGDVTMMHNGTLHSYTGLVPGEHFETDSETVCAAISKVSPDDVGDVISKLDGAFALVWYDQRDKSLNFIRNNERELYIGIDSPHDPVNCKAIVWASEKAMIDLTVDRSKSKYEVAESFLLTPMKHLKVFVEQGHITWGQDKQYEAYKRPVYNVTTNIQSLRGNPQFTYRMYNSTGLVEFDYIQLKSVKEVATNPHCLQGHYQDGNNHPVQVNLYFTKNKKQEKLDELKQVDNWVCVKNIYNVNGAYMASAVVLTEEEFAFHNEEVTEDEIVTTLLGQQVPGKDGLLISVEDYVEQTKDGCGVCDAAISVTDADEVVWMGESPICPYCKDWAKSEYLIGEGG